MTKILPWALAALFLSATSSAAQITPPPTPVLPCDANAITGSRSAPARVIATRNSDSAATEQRLTSISLSSSNGATRYFVEEREVTLAQLGRATGEAWLANTPGASIDQCWSNGITPVGEYAIAGRLTTICRIVLRADDDVSYSGLSAARDALRDAGFTRLALMTSDQTRAVFDEHLPLNPVPIRLEGIAMTTVRIVSPPDATEPVVSIGGTAAPLTQFAGLLARETARNNPALLTHGSIEDARICVRPSSTIAYGDVLRVISAIRDQGFRRAGLHSTAVVAVDDQGLPR
jgi:biopolymer transport protein ExbD